MTNNTEFIKIWNESKNQRFEPTRVKPGRSWVEEYRRKDFSQGNLLELFHQNTKGSRDTALKRQPAVATFSSDDRYKYLQTLTPDFPQAERIELPAAEPLEAPIGSVLASRRSRRDMPGESLPIQDVSTLLQHSCGVTGSVEVDVGPVGPEEMETTEQHYRAYPSGGAMYPVRTYLLVMHPSEELDRGLYYYAPSQHALQRLKRDPDLPERIREEEMFSIFEGTLDPTDASVTFVLTAQFWRSMAKYGPAAYRIVMQESGHVGQNLLLAAEAKEFAATPLNSFNDDAVNEYLDVNGVDEAAIYAIGVGTRATSGNDDK